MSKKITNEKELKKSYEEIWGKYDLTEERSYYGWILNLLKVNRGQKLLDVACGGGYLLNAAIQKDMTSYGIDISQNAISKAKKLNNHPEFILASSESIPFDNECFDYITCLGSLEHFLNPEKSLYEMGRVLKDSGKICIVLPNIWSIPDVLRGWFKGDGLSHGQENERFYSLNEAKALIDENSIFKIDKIEKYNQSPETIKIAKPLPKFNNIYITLYKLFLNKIPVSASYVFVFICTKRFLDAPSKIEMGNESDERFLPTGWYHTENWPPYIRWTRERAFAFLKIDKISSKLFIKAKTNYPGINVRISINRQFEERISFDDAEWKIIDVNIKDVDTNIIEVMIDVDKTWIPDELLKNGDTRELGIAVEKIWIEQ